MKRLLYLTTALGAMMVLGTPGIQAEGPICPRWECGSRGSALDGHQVMLPDGLQIGGTSAAERWRSVTKRAALDNRQVEASDLPGVRSDPRRFPGDAWEVRPIDQRWPDASRDWLVEQ
jgi:hypothetical protein